MNTLLRSTALIALLAGPAFAQDTTGDEPTDTAPAQEETAPESAPDTAPETTSEETPETAPSDESTPSESSDAETGTDSDTATDTAPAEQDGTNGSGEETAQDDSEPEAPAEEANSQARISSDARVPASGPDWPSFHGQVSGAKYSPLDQITPENVGEMELAWRYETGDVSDGSGDLPATVWSATPIYANGLLYIGTPFYRVLALDPATGEEVWSFDSQSTLEALTQPALKNRGVAYWEADEPVEGEACQKIVYLGTMDARLFAVDADTGEQCENFADGGVLDVNQWNTVNDRWPLSLLQPPTIVGDHVVIGWAGNDWDWAEAPPGSIFSVNAQTGELEWTFDTIPEEIREKTGTANVWTAMSADEERGIVYLPVASPSPNYWGGNRTEDIPYATSTTALDVETGEVIWSRQWVHHDIWDYDINAAPTLMDITVDGEEIPALMQATKMGFLFVVNRETGEDVWPIEERPVPAGDIEGERYAETQPFPTKPAPLLDQSKLPDVWWLADVASFGACSKLWDDMVYEGMYTAPTTEGAGAGAYPNSAGVVQWGGVGFDPDKQLAVVNLSHVVQHIQLYERERYEEINGEAGPGESGFHPQTGAPYGMSLQTALNRWGMPCWEPPFGELAAIDMTTGEIAWRRPFGMSQRYGFYMPEGWGSPTIGGPAITRGGLIFIGATMDAMVRAYDLETGEELWSDITEAPSVSNPAVYEHDGAQYVAFVSGGNSILKPSVGDMVSVYRLPQQ
ncbi:quinoprotein glucose dehydrogenase (plasmid) [Salipiger profundus]|jgi:quinoprotein glucose dehydrogenase|uniref:Quinoprotein glucose dehydrogenase n=1 Tax=Salipiger profundus TaxID=1229727 RepID=A0A1U7DCL9_9RHOB|nr:MULTISPECIES: PQQ-binding-like beta-propeller repeat protein [Salipiger]APX25873.1 quinoprotein glucose dehydrogenase [Salipiger profundus]SFC81197.1 quinoprotein glucose dehydrogenase [Salipiger profundus]